MAYKKSKPNKPQNKLRHKWDDIGLAKDGIATYEFKCRHCGKFKSKMDSFESLYYDDNKKIIGNRAPECSRLLQ